MARGCRLGFFLQVHSSSAHSAANLTSNSRVRATVRRFNEFFISVELCASSVELQNYGRQCRTGVTGTLTNDMIIRCKFGMNLLYLWNCL